MGCKAITPHLVGLAKRLESKPFHLVASHCQRNTQENVVEYIRGKGLSPDAPNFTVTSFGRHPKVKGNGYVPYYMVFDQHGELAYHHMCGDYHGGDGLKMIEWVDKLLKDAPAIYLGKEPFEVHRKLAAQVGKRKKLPAAILEIDRRLEARPEDAEKAELERLREAIADYKARMLQRADSLMAGNPPEVLPALEALSKDFKGTPMAADVEAKLAEMRKSGELKQSISIFKGYRKALRRLEKMKEPSSKARRKTADKLEKLIEGHEQLPVAATVKETIASLRS
ncbi:MAG: thioredoxin domain-containing protein [Planctomycetota bacterium]